MTDTTAPAAAPSEAPATGIFTHVPHPRIAARKESGPAKTSDQRTKGKGPIGRLNARVGVMITVAVGTMWTAYLFTLLALISLPAAVKSHDTIILVAWVAQTFLQLVLLPIIIVGQNVQAAAADERSLATYNDASAVLEEARQIQAHLLAQDAAIQQILASLAATAEPSATRPEPDPA